MVHIQIYLSWIKEFFTHLDDRVIALLVLESKLHRWWAPFFKRSNDSSYQASRDPWLVFRRCPRNLCECNNIRREEKEKTEEKRKKKTEKGINQQSSKKIYYLLLRNGGQRDQYSVDRASAGEKICVCSHRTSLFRAIRRPLCHSCI